MVSSSGSGRAASSRCPCSWIEAVLPLQPSKPSSMDAPTWIEGRPIVANLPVVRGRLSNAGGRAILAARCPLCGHEHRYDKGSPNDPDVAELHALGFSEEWLPCQWDLPGNYWRITFGNVRRRKPNPPRSGQESEGRKPEGRPPPPGRGDSRQSVAAGDAGSEQQKRPTGPRSGA